MVLVIHHQKLYNLQGTRYAVMQEPSKGDKINEGIMKEITGGDPITSVEHYLKNPSHLFHNLN